MSFPSHQKVFTVSAANVASFNAVTETYGTPVDIPNLQTIEPVPQHDTDMLKIYGANEDMLAVMTDLQLNLTFGGIDWATMAIMANLTLVTTGSTPNLIQSTEYTGGGAGLSSFGMTCKMLANNGTDLHLYFPKVVLESYPPLSGEMNTFLLPQITARALRLRKSDNSTIDICMLVANETPASLPTDFNTAFGV